MLLIGKKLLNDMQQVNKKFILNLPVKKQGVLFLAFLFSLILISPKTNAQEQFKPFKEKKNSQTTTEQYTPIAGEKKTNNKLTAVLLGVTLGPLGVHRIFLGTSKKVPVAYALTLGGLGILPLIDIAHLIFKKDISPYQGNQKVFMWTN